MFDILFPSQQIKTSGCIRNFETCTIIWITAKFGYKAHNNMKYNNRLVMKKGKKSLHISPSIEKDLISLLHFVSNIEEKIRVSSHVPRSVLARGSLLVWSYTQTPKDLFL